MYDYALANKISFVGFSLFFTKIGHFSKTADIFRTALAQCAKKQKGARFILSFYSSWDI